MKVTDIKEGEIITIFSCFDGKTIHSNRVVKISDDYSELNRDIGYFAYVDRGPVITKEMFLHNMKNGIYVPGKVMAIWQWELEYSDKLMSISNDTNTIHH
jgi:hypothetical protein